MSDAINPDHYKRLPSEAIEIIESAIDKAPSNQDAYLHGQVLKYILRCWNKNGIEDLKKAKWYLDRLVNSLDEYETQKAADFQSLKDHPFGKLKEPAIKQPSLPEPPDGWRWLEVGEVIRNGDRYFKDHEWFGYDLWVGGKIRETDRPSVRRNRFNVGEIVVHVNGIEPCEVVGFDREKDKYWITSNGNEYAYESKWIAPYIEDAT